MASLELQSLPNLRAVSLIALGPDPHPGNDPGVNKTQWFEMFKSDVQHIDCVLRDIPDQIALKHPFFCKYRPMLRFVS